MTLRIDFMNIRTGEVYASAPSVAVENGRLVPATPLEKEPRDERRHYNFPNGLTLSVVSLDDQDMLEIAILDSNTRKFVGKDVFPAHFAWDNVLRLGSGEDSLECWIERVRTWLPE